MNRFSKFLSTRDLNFGALWSGQTVSGIGSALSAFVVPTVAVLRLHVSPLELGILEAAEYAAFPLFGLFAGVMVDRVSRLTVMLSANVIRCSLAAFLGYSLLVNELTFLKLLIISALIGLARVFFDIAYQALLPNIVSRERLSSANAKLRFSESVAQYGGVSISGYLYQTLGAPVAFFIDSVSFAISGISLLLIRVKPDVSLRKKTRPHFFKELGEGLVAVVHSPVIRSVVATTATINFGLAMRNAVLIIYLYQQLHFSPELLTVLFGIGNLAFVGAAFSTAITRRLGLGPTLALSAALCGLSFLPLPLGSLALPIIVFLVSRTLETAAMTIYNINGVALRQSMAGEHLQGRVNATARTIGSSVLPIGAIVGGFLGMHIGLTATIVVSTLVQIASVLWILPAPTFKLKQIPATSDYLP